MRFRDQFDEVGADLCLEGHVVLGPNVWGNEKKTGYIDDANPLKKTLEAVHLKKIDLSEGIVVINVGGYVGKSTRNEITYARKNGKRVFWYEIVQAAPEGDLSPNDLAWKALLTPESVVTVDSRKERPKKMLAEHPRAISP